ncbi:MAG: group 1 glycosyl transferase [Fluviicola sp. XM-24bin1]|nr:MAG: group 1 glycosyl transferase [Fluviicola sp. XM-24bin1]
MQKSMSKRILFIAPYPNAQAPSQRFRFEQYIPALKEAGFEIEVNPFLSAKDWAPLYKEGSFARKGWSMVRSFIRRWGLMTKIRRFDYIFIHREASMIGPPVFEFIIAKVLRKKYIYDFDDAIWLPNYSQSNAKFHRLKAYGKVKKIIRWADSVVVGNSFLAEYASKYNDNVQIIPTTIDLENVHNLVTKHQEDVIRIGWTGSHTTMEYLPLLVPTLKELEQNHPIKFRVISNHPPEIELDCLEYVKWDKDSEIEDLAAIHIGVMPLKDSIWAKGKCGFKGLQYMSLEIPSVMSAVGVNPEIVENGENGFLIEKEEDWRHVLLQLIQDIELRKKIGKAGHQTVKDRYSVAANTPKYLALFQ